MARPITLRRTGMLKPVPQTPALVPTDVAYWAPPKGVNYVVRSSRIGVEHAWDARNWTIIDGRLEPRRPLSTVGDATSNYCEVGLFVTTDGVIHVFRMTTTTIQYWNGATWATPVGAPTLTGSASNHLSYTAWTDNGQPVMVWTNGKDGLYQWNWTTNTVSVISTTYIPKWVTTFMSRIFMGNMIENVGSLPARMRWTSKNSNTNLDNIAIPGFGYEDFLSTPEGYVDQFHAMIPVNDVQALVFKEDSTWLISETGNVDTPIRIGRQFPKLGTKAPRSFVSAPGGAIGLFKDGIYVVSESNVQNIGQAIIRRIQSNVSDFDSCIGTYDNDLKRYSLSVFDDELQQSVLYQYSFPDEAWMPHQYDLRISSLRYASSAVVGLTIDSATDTFDAAVGTIDSEVGSLETSQLFISGAGVRGYDVHKESSFSEPTVLDSESNTVAYLVTGLIQAESPLRNTTIVEIQIEYESDHSLQGTIEYSTNLGAGWLPYSVLTLDSTSGPTIKRFAKVITGHNIQLRFSITLFNSQFKLLAFVPNVLQDGKVNP